MLPSPLVDSSRRRIRKLRVSLLDACNFRCFYCMPVNVKFMPAAKWLRPDEIESICQNLVQFGIEQVRLTGGEPTFRRDFRDIVTRLSKLPVTKLGLTTNGFLLAKHLPFLKDTRCQHINISLDSLNEERFHKITRTSVFKQVRSSILQAQELGFNVKLNVVLMKGVNDDELLDFVAFSSEHGIAVRFLELMKIGQACKWQTARFMDAGTLVARLQESFSLAPELAENDSTSFNFKLANGARIGFIASESRPFCGSCSRWRLSADGFLRACLMAEKGVNLRGVLKDDYLPLLQQVLHMKPRARLPDIQQDMYQIGG
ncbi:MAG: GTP 3',8-cyclase MoaA [Deltaproteobacteria bacterium]|nr:GTP 3',8-cyclase MoaA [Deltaproteobacteria bacterium]